MRSPEKPWVKGVHPEYTALQLVVNVCQDQHGNVWSDHGFLSPADEVLARGLPQGGAPQLAHVFLTEAVRREAFMCALLELTKDPDFLSRRAAGQHDRVETDLQFFVTHTITRALEKMRLIIRARRLCLELQKSLSKLAEAHK